MSRPRFFCPDLRSTPAVLTGDEARHAWRVLRLRAGDDADLFDGQGGHATARVIGGGPDRVELMVLEHRALTRPSKSLDLAVAMPKGERADWLVEKLAEFGVSSLIPLRAARGVSDPGAARVERWNRKAEAAAKQSGASFLLAVRPVRAPGELAREWGRHERVLLADPSPQAEWLSAGIAALAGGATLALIGPEGGFTDDELRVMESAGARRVRLSATVLRIETAAVAMAAAWAMAGSG